MKVGNPLEVSETIVIISASDTTPILNNQKKITTEAKTNDIFQRTCKGLGAIVIGSGIGTVAALLFNADLTYTIMFDAIGVFFGCLYCMASVCCSDEKK